MTDFFLTWNDQRAKHGGHVRGITVDARDLQPFGRLLKTAGGFSNLKFLPSEVYNSKVSIESCHGQFVRIVLFESVETLIIESPKFALAVKEVFELLWKNLEGKYDKPATWEK